MYARADDMNEFEAIQNHRAKKDEVEVVVAAAVEVTSQDAYLDYKRSCDVARDTSNRARGQLVYRDRIDYTQDRALEPLAEVGLVVEAAA